LLFLCQADERIADPFDIRMGREDIVGVLKVLYKGSDPGLNRAAPTTSATYCEVDFRAADQSLMPSAVAAEATTCTYVLYIEKKSTGSNSSTHDEPGLLRILSVICIAI
jgi:hypothetical protein